MPDSCDVSDIRKADKINVIKNILQGNFQLNWCVKSVLRFWVLRS